MSKQEGHSAKKKNELQCRHKKCENQIQAN